MNARELTKKVRALPTQDGDGVKIKRIGGRMMQRDLDPFLMVDEINSDDAADYIGGFPPHPHRGFETITYMKAGRMRHRDHMGNEGVIGAGDVQWMRAAKGVIHSETPEQQDGLLHGFQLWLNLPATEKMKPAAYHDFKVQEIPRFEADGVEVRAVAGEVEINAQSQTKKLSGALPEFITEPVFLDVVIAANGEVDLSFNSAYPAQVYVYQGNEARIKFGEMGLFAAGEYLRLKAGDQGLSALVISGKPLNEPIAQYGPFVMNTEAELRQAMVDYQAGTLTD